MAIRASRHILVGALVKCAYGDSMVGLPSPFTRTRTLIGIGIALGALSLPAPAAARTPDDEPATKRRKLIPYKALETQATVVGQLLPTPSFGLDAALAFGTEVFQFRLGAIVLGAPPFSLGGGKIANVLGAVTGDICVAKNVYRNQIRMCMGGQGGAMAHRWIGFDRPGRKLTAWWAGTLGGDYRYALTERFGVMGSVGVVIPVMGPSFRAYDQYGSPTPLVFPGPVGGKISLGTSWRF